MDSGGGDGIKKDGSSGCWRSMFKDNVVNCETKEMINVLTD